MTEFMPDREQALILASGLAWAVGHVQGLGHDPGYAGEVLKWWREPHMKVGDNPWTPPVPTEPVSS